MNIYVYIRYEKKFVVIHEYKLIIHGKMFSCHAWKNVYVCVCMWREKERETDRGRVINGHRDRINTREHICTEWCFEDLHIYKAM